MSADLNNLTIVDHPVVQHWATIRADKRTPRELYRRAGRALAPLIAGEALRLLSAERRTYPSFVSHPDNPDMQFPGHTITRDVVVVKVLRPLDSAAAALLDLCPWATIGYAGFERDKETHTRAISYMWSIPRTGSAMVFVVDEMLASGVTAIAVLERLTQRPHHVAAFNIVYVCYCAAPEGVRTVNEAFPDVRIVAAKFFPDGLNDTRYIIGGPGDANDRENGTDGSSALPECLRAAADANGAGGARGGNGAA